jgi:hypothetical protein
MSTVDTKGAPRRALRFGSVAELDAELDRIEKAQRDGRLVTTGNWTPGQIFNHIATWLEFGWKGYPPNVRPPFFIKWLLKRKKPVYLRDGMPAGVRIPKLPSGTLGMDAATFEEGMRRLRAALEPLRRGEAPPHASPAFGMLSAEEAAQLNLRHAELHLGFLKYD